MPGIFLSHSTADKPFVIKLAIDLVNRGFPVWLDAWEMDTGDTLLDRINRGIDESTLVIVVLSEHSVASSWVKKELGGALTREQQLGHTLILPVKIGECQVPLKVRGRLYADFSQSYHEPLDRLVASLRKQGADKIAIPPEEQIVPLVFTNGLHLNEVLLRQRIKALLPLLPTGFQFESRQFLVSPDEKYTELRRRVLARMDKAASDPNWSHGQDAALHDAYAKVTKEEERLLEGIKIIVNALALVPHEHSGPYATACYWYAKIVRSQTLSLLGECQDSRSANVLDNYPDVVEAPLLNRKRFAQLFGITEAASGYIRPMHRRGGDGLTPWIDLASPAGEYIGRKPPVPANDLLSTTDYLKYVIPQMVYNHLDAHHGCLIWDFSDYVFN